MNRQLQQYCSRGSQLAQRFNSRIIAHWNWIYSLKDKNKNRPESSIADALRHKRTL